MIPTGAFAFVHFLRLTLLIADDCSLNLVIPSAYFIFIFMKVKKFSPLYKRDTGMFTVF